jgi:outer membrane protein
MEKIKKHIQLIINIILIITILFIGYTLLTQKKVAYVNNSLLISNSNIGTETRKNLESKIAEFQTEVNNRESELEILKDLSKKDSANITIKNELSEKIAAYTAYLQELDKELSKYETELMAPVYNTINKALDEYGKKHNYSIILGATSSGNIVYGDIKLDITEKVLVYMNNMPVEMEE